ncbi:MAG: Gfo/Idh/MocA family oxidoreductase [Ruminococcaceae bacterium]|nr:Gfo/Idh/MocA family oxidoreductase [Oscillospiraceae bacterium]
MKFAMCGVWHVHAPGYLNTALKYAECVGVFERDEARRKDFCEKNNLPEFASLDELLASDADSVIVCSASCDHAEDMVKLAKAGKNIFTEKVLALTTEECLAIEEAVKAAGVRFVISLPHKYAAGPRTVRAIVDSGELGKLNYVRLRNCHNGSTGDWLPDHFYDLRECGGGAMIDLGAHGMYIADWFLGLPVGYASAFTLANDNPRNADRVEDNAITIMQYANGAIAVNETGFVSVGSPMALEVGGDRGFVRWDDRGVVKSTWDTERKPVAVELLEAAPSPLEQFMSGEILPGCGMEEAKHLTAMMEGAYAAQIK